MALHGAADAETDWDWYGELIGARFDRHPHIQPAVLRSADRAQTWPWTDEFYDFSSAPRDVEVLWTLDESTYEGGGMGSHHPIAWRHLHEGSRIWYTALGHAAEAYVDGTFRDHLKSGLRYVLGHEPSPSHRPAARYSLASEPDGDLLCPRRRPAREVRT